MMTDQSGLRPWQAVHFAQHPSSRAILATALAIGIAAALAGCGIGTSANNEVTAEPSTVSCADTPDPDFYTPPADLPSAAGNLIRCEKMQAQSKSGDPVFTGGTLYRVMYSSTNGKGGIVPVTGMVALPDSSRTNRPVVAWAHGTVGPAVTAAPSMTADNMNGIAPWINTAMAQGWVVAMTDYQGLGIEGITSDYLVGNQEAADVVGSVQAARQMPGANAGTTWLGWGHSQGGHSIAWSANRSKELAPELRLAGIGLAAPAIRVASINEFTWNNAYSWIIGANVFQAWLTAHPENDLRPYASDTYVKDAARIAKMAVAQVLAYGYQKEHSTPKQNFYKGDPGNVAPINKDAQIETPTPPDPALPVFIAQGLKDNLVPPTSNLAVIKQWSANGSKVTQDVVPSANHFTIVTLSADAFTDWATPILSPS